LFVGDAEAADFGLALHGLHAVKVASAGQIQRTYGRAVPDILLLVSGPGRGANPGPLTPVGHLPPIEEPLLASKSS
jgi:hypothetical protein